jgi:hypothetical protein
VAQQAVAFGLEMVEQGEEEQAVAAHLSDNYSLLNL